MLSLKDWTAVRISANHFPKQTIVFKWLFFFPRQTFGSHSFSHMHEIQTAKVQNLLREKSLHMVWAVLLHMISVKCHKCYQVISLVSPLVGWLRLKTPSLKMKYILEMERKPTRPVQPAPHLWSRLAALGGVSHC